MYAKLLKTLLVLSVCSFAHHLKSSWLNPNSWHFIGISFYNLAHGWIQKSSETKGVNDKYVEYIKVDLIVWRGEGGAVNLFLA